MVVVMIRETTDGLPKLLSCGYEVTHKVYCLRHFHLPPVNRCASVSYASAKRLSRLEFHLLRPIRVIAQQYRYRYR